MNKKSLLLALITGTAPLIAQEKPSQVLESLMQPLPSVEANIQARAAAYPALRQIPSSACAFVVMADVQDNIKKLLNTKLLIEASEGQSAKNSASIPPIESIAIAFEEGAEANIAALFAIFNNFSTNANCMQYLKKWQASSKEEYQASFASIFAGLQANSIQQSNSIQDIFKGVNNADINIPEMRIITTMRPGSEALVTQMKQQFDALLAESGKMIPMPLIEQDGYTVISLPLAMGVAMILKRPAGSMDAIVKSQHYLAVKFEGNCISVIYSHDLKKIGAVNIEQSMLSSDKLKLSDALLTQGIVGCSFTNAKLANKLNKHNPYAVYGVLLENIFQSLAQNHADKAPVFKAATLATAQLGKQLEELRINYINHFKSGNHASVLWSNGKLNYMAARDYQGSFNYTSGKLNAWNQIDKAETIGYFSVSPINRPSLDFDSKAFMQNARTILKASSQTFNERTDKKLQRMDAKLKENSEKIKTAYQALCDINKGTDGSIAFYADNAGSAADLCKKSCASKVLKEDKAPRLAILSSVSDKLKIDTGILALQGLCEQKCDLGDKYMVSDKLVSFSNSAALNQSLQKSVAESSSSKEFTGSLLYLNIKAIETLIKHKDAKKLQLMPELYFAAYPNDGKIILRATIK